MFECEWDIFINEYGREERYLCKSITSRLTEHTYCNSPFETDDSCGNCSGANCDSCREIYTVSKYGIPRTTNEGYREEVIVKRMTFSGKREAMEYYNDL